jgi:hypothetical protein
MRPDGTDVTRIADAPGIGVAGDLVWEPLAAPVVTVEPTPPPTDAEVVDTFAVGPDLRSVVFGEGSVWVATSNNDDSKADGSSRSTRRHTGCRPRSPSRSSRCGRSAVRSVVTTR